jgi:RNA-directed DNA polymerase
MNKTEGQKTTVPQTAELPSEAQARWAWAEPSVWTDRMLDARDHGIRGDKETKWFCLNDKVFSPANLLSAYRKVSRNGGAAGVDHLDVKRFVKDLENRLERIGRQLQAGEYYPNAVRRTHIPKPGSKETRALGIPTVRDRVVQTAGRHVIEPIFEREFTDGSYGFRPGRGCKDALREVDRLLKEGYTHVVDADLRKCFDRIPHGLLMEQVRERVADRKLLELIVRLLKQKIMEEGLEYEPEESAKRHRAKLRPITRRTNGHSMKTIIHRCNRILKGWYEYFKHARPRALQLLDGWVRMRLRSILRGYHKRKGRGRGLDHQRWPNRYFEELGLFSMYTVWVEESSPRRG